MIVSIDPIARRVIARGPPGGLPKDSPGRRSAHLRRIFGAFARGARRRPATRPGKPREKKVHRRKPWRLGERLRNLTPDF
ncbi:hypothetical protein, partial [Burkholderia pseudomallei]